MKIDKKCLAVLHSLGFKREYRSSDVIQYRLGTSAWLLFIQVQFWEDGGHRVSHGHLGRENTKPIDFADAEGLLIAILQEATCDGKHRWHGLGNQLDSNFEKGDGKI